MKKEKIFIALNHLNIPNSLAEYGVDLAKASKNTAHLFGLAGVSATTPPLNVLGTENNNTISLQRSAREVAVNSKITEIFAEVQKKYNHISYETEIGAIESTVISNTEEHAPFLVVIEGSNEWNTFQEWFGTYETRMAKAIDTPVLIVPQKYPFKPIKNILYVMDMEDERMDNLTYLTTIAKALKATLTVVIIEKKQESSEEVKFLQIVEKIKQSLHYPAVNFQRIFAKESVKLIKESIENTSADWFVFEHQETSFLEKILGEVNTKKLIQKSNIPVLVF